MRWIFIFMLFFFVLFFRGQCTELAVSNCTALCAKHGFGLASIEKGIITKCKCK